MDMILELHEVITCDHFKVKLYVWKIISSVCISKKGSNVS